jgi:hypothetical protein
MSVGVSDGVAVISTGGTSAPVGVEVGGSNVAVAVGGIVTEGGSAVGGGVSVGRGVSVGGIAVLVGGGTSVFVGGMSVGGG